MKKCMHSKNRVEKRAETAENKGEAAENKAKDHGGFPSIGSRICLQPLSYANCAPTSDAEEHAFRTHMRSSIKCPLYYYSMSAFMMLDMPLTHHAFCFCWLSARSGTLVMCPPEWSDDFLSSVERRATPLQNTNAAEDPNRPGQNQASTSYSVGEHTLASMIYIYIYIYI